MKRTFILVILLLSFQPVIAKESMLTKLGWISSAKQLEANYSHPQLLEEVYNAVNHQLIWLDPVALERLTMRYKVLHLAQLSDTFSSVYQQLLEAQRGVDFYHIDLVATDAYLLYLAYVDAAKYQHKNWFYGQKQISYIPFPDSKMAKQLAHVFMNDYRMSKLFTDTHPFPEMYDQLQQWLDNSEYDIELANETFKQTLKPGVTIRSPQRLKAKLARVGITVDTHSTVYADPWISAMKDFQHQHGLAVDGVVGAKTRDWLNYPQDERVRILALNVERSRSWPTQRDSIIQVNLPAYRLNYWHKEQLSFESNVIIGKAERSTPLMKLKMSSLVMNPNWKIPLTIMREDIIPKLVHDKEYLSKRGIKVVADWGSDEVIPDDSINWNEVNPDTFKYRMVQGPGPGNALGLYKFVTPNRQAIYLHDTPAKSLFKRPLRAYSSGCIRVANAKKFAKTLLSNQNIEYRPAQAGKITEVRFNRRVPVQFIYQSAWIEDGRVHMHEDIYGHDHFSSTLESVAKSH